MKSTVYRTSVIAALLLAAPILAGAQDVPRKSAQEITSLQKSQQQKAHAVAAEKGWPISGTTESGSSWELVRLNKDGSPVIISSLDSIAVISSNLHKVHEMDPPVLGASVTVGVWDEGAALTTHQEFATPDGSRVINSDGSSLSNHGTAVVGIVSASAVNPDVTGSAPAVRIESRDWGNDLGEMADRAAYAPAQTDRLPISNHSYGEIAGWEKGNYSGVNTWTWFGSNWKPDGSGWNEDATFGQYGFLAAQLDSIVEENPWYLPFQAAGNDRNDKFGGADGSTFRYFDYATNSWADGVYDSATAPVQEVNGRYDTLLSRTVAKNIVTVGAVDDAVTNGERDPQAGTMTAYSAWGPADDGRIKPDIVANGHRLRVTIATGDDQYGTGAASGTSFSSPSAAGAAAVLLDYAQTNLPHWSPRASTLKGLLIHGATDLGRPGPDYEYGWGLVDALSSLKPLQRAAGTELSASPVREARLDPEIAQAGHIRKISWDGTEPLKVTVCWTDPAGMMRFGLDDRTPSLVHDLDLVVIGPGGTSHYPFVLDPENPEADATTERNAVDNVEQVLLSAGGEPGEYTIIVRSQGELHSSQWYSLIICGQTCPDTPEPLMIATAPASEETFDGKLNITVNGSGFAPGTTAVLQPAIGQPIAPVMSEPGDMLLTTAFSSQKIADGIYDLVVMRPDGLQTVWPGALMVGDNASVDDWRQLEF